MWITIFLLTAAVASVARDDLAGDRNTMPPARLGGKMGKGKAAMNGPCRCGEPCSLMGNRLSGLCQVNGRCEVSTIVPICDEQSDTTLCPKDFERCPNGYFVGREPPSCEFKECPKDCECGKSCNMTDGELGICQVNGECALEKMDANNETMKLDCPPKSKKDKKDHNASLWGDEHNSSITDNDDDDDEHNSSFMGEHGDENNSSFTGENDMDQNASSLEACVCGESCELKDGAVGICQEDLECAINIIVPQCPPKTGSESSFPGTGSSTRSESTGMSTDSSSTDVSTTGSTGSGSRPIDFAGSTGSLTSSGSTTSRTSVGSGSVDSTVSSPSMDSTGGMDSADVSMNTKGKCLCGKACKIPKTLKNGICNRNGLCKLGKKKAPICG
jgi:hypothetical protein